MRSRRALRVSPKGWAAPCSLNQTIRYSGQKPLPPAADPYQAGRDHSDPGAQSQTADHLGAQLSNGMFNQLRVAAIGKTGGYAPDPVEPGFRLPQQEPPSSRETSPAVRSATAS